MKQMTTVLDFLTTHEPLTLDRVISKQITIGIIGLGYVGVPLALSFASQGVRVVGFDVDQTKVTMIQQGESYYKHICKKSFKPLTKKKLLSATTDYQYISACDAIIICVPTPLNENLEPDLQYIVQTCESIKPHIEPGTLVSLESTTWPGTVDEIVVPYFSEKQDIYVCYSPEREDPGNKDYNTKNIPKLLSGINRKSLEFGKALYALAIDTVVPVKTTKAAEAAKLFENIFRSVNIALVNEMKIICDEMDIDVWEVLSASSTKPFGFMPFSPGPGLGGHCIPIDPYYLSWKARQYGINTRFIELAGEINRSMPKYVIAKVQDCLNLYEKSLKGSKILILGLAYKADIDDMRESPSLELMRLLTEKGARVSYYDPYLPTIPQNRKFQQFIGMQNTHPSSEYDCFLLATAHSCFSPQEFLSHGVPIVDTRNFFPAHDNVFRS
ncbi:MAG: nucleotide sugar dehydrogenase [Chlamydiota bacterium]